MAYAVKDRGYVAGPYNLERRRPVDDLTQDSDLLESRPAAATDDSLTCPPARAQRILGDLDEGLSPLERRLLARLGSGELVPGERQTRLRSA